MSELTFRIEKAQHISIGGHVRPDGDCVGSCLGLFYYLRNNYPNIEVSLMLDEIPEKFHYLVTDDFKMTKPTMCELFIALDCGSLDRMNEEAQAVFKRSYRTICIDHHKTNDRFAKVNYVSTEASSTCEVLYELLEPNKMNKDVATALYTGIVHDTGVFKYSCTAPKTMRIAGELMEKDVEFTKIIDETFFMKNYRQKQILGRCLLASIRVMDGKCIFAVVTNKMKEFYGAQPDDLTGVIEQLRTTEGVEIAILLSERDPNEFKVSLRSNDMVDVSTIAEFFGGGGHVRAAGCVIKGSQYDVINNLTEHISNQLKE